MEQQDTLYVRNQDIIFRSAGGKEIPMPNLTELLRMYNETTDEVIKDRIQAILNEPIGRLCVVEIMVDMTNKKTLERLRTGEICKTMGHVSTYNVILDSNIAEAKEIFRQGDFVGEFEAICFAQFPYGMVVEESKFPNFENTRCIKCIELN